MSERYLITGVQLGILGAAKSLLKAGKILGAVELMDYVTSDVEKYQFIGNSKYPVVEDVADLSAKNVFRKKEG